MQAQRITAALPELIAALSGQEILQTYLEHLDQELPGCGDAALLRHLRQLRDEAQRLQQEGLDQRAAIDRSRLDALLCDVLAVATWEDWPLPARLGDGFELPLEPLPRGLLGADESQGGVLVFQLPDGDLALCRARSADSCGDMSEHWNAPGHGHHPHAGGSA